MANLLVHVAGDRAHALRARAAQAHGQVWTLRPEDLPLPQLDLLDELSTLFIVVVEDDRALALATLENVHLAGGHFGDGEAILRETDISGLLRRLGCPDVASVATWASVPRVLPPGDVQLLRYALAMDDPDGQLPATIPPEPEPAPRAPGPERPTPRTVPVQAAPAASHELGALAPYVLPGYELRKGALVRCAIDDHRPLPDELLADPRWSTVEDLATRNAKLLLSPALRALRTARVSGEAAVKLGLHTSPLPIEVLTGLPAASLTGGGGDRGIWLADWDDWRHVTHSEALRRLRVLGIHAAMPRVSLTSLVKSPLAARLAQLDLYVMHATSPVVWRDAFDSAGIALVTLRFTLDGEVSTAPLRPRLPTTGPLVVVGLAHDSRSAAKLIIQIRDPLTSDEALDVVRYCTQLDVRVRGMPGIQHVEVNDLADPAAIEQRQPTLLGQLRLRFAHVVVGPGRPLAP